MEETINKKSDTELEITRTETPVKRKMPKADIERNIANLEKDLIYWKELLNYFK